MTKRNLKKWTLQQRTPAYLHRRGLWHGSRAGWLLRRAGLSLACCLCLLAAGCDRGLFKARGHVASEGANGALGSWHSAPEACSRDPLDGRPIGQSNSIAVFLWEDPSVHDPMRDQHRSTAPDAPMRLELARDRSGFRANLTTIKTDRLGVAGVAFAPSDCALFDLQTWEQAPLVARSRPGLAGRLRMDCQVRGSHVTADLEFKRCEF